MAKDVTVKVIRLADPTKCRVEPNPFKTEPGGTVTFTFEFPAPDGHVVFVGPSPFSDDPATPGKFRPNHAHKVRDIKEPSKFKYEVRWGDVGNGDGQGEVIPS